MNIIWKFKLDEKIYLPIGAKILTIQTQQGQPFIWALVNNSKDMEERYFRVFGTGQPMNDFKGEYIGTYQQLNGLLIFHVFEKTKL